MIPALFGILIIEYLFSPRIDFTINKNLLLWYGRKVRNFYIIF